MHSKTPFHDAIFGLSWNLSNTPITFLLTLLLLVFLFVGLTTLPAIGQTYTVLHNFTGLGDGKTPTAGLALDPAGNLYGTTQYGGFLGNGTVYRLALHHGMWTETIYAFEASSADGAFPTAGVVFGPDGQLYGATSWGGYGYGAVFSLRPPATACETALCGWEESMLTVVAPPGCDGAGIGYGDVAFDSSGAIYETTIFAGYYDVGTIFRVFPSDSGWTCQDGGSFNWADSGGNTEAGVTLVGDTIYGVATMGGQYGFGTVYIEQGGIWPLYAFQNGEDGSYPVASLISDAAGNLYGTTQGGGSGGGTVFEVTSSGNFELLYSFTDGGNSRGSLNFDAAGNLYGTLCSGGPQRVGSVFRLTHETSGWTYSSLHDFSGGDGACPFGRVSLDANGNLYGTASQGGSYGYGVVWKITP